MASQTQDTVLHAHASQGDLMPRGVEEKCSSSEEHQAPLETQSVEKYDGYLPWGPKLFAIVGSLMLGVFCMALDNTVCHAPAVGVGVVDR